MAVENDAPENLIGGFGVKERIESTDFVRNNLGSGIKREDYVHIVDEYWVGWQKER